mgnify:CR=1 FL=1
MRISPVFSNPRKNSASARGLIGSSSVLVSFSFFATISTLNSGLVEKSSRRLACRSFLPDRFPVGAFLEEARRRNVTPTFARAYSVLAIQNERSQIDSVTAFRTEHHFFFSSWLSRWPQYSSMLRYSFPQSWQIMRIRIITRSPALVPSGRPTLLH